MAINLSQVLIRPIITEKSMDGSDLGRYTFEVHPDANQTLIKQAFKKFLRVDPVKINISNVKGKARRYGRTSGWTKSWKKAIVTVKPGQKIELFES